MVAALDRHLALVGFMGAGKSAVGADVARRLDRPFLDLDEEIERRTRSTVVELFRETGEPGFRSIEEETVVEVLGRHQPAVLALGGGAILSPATRDALRERALAVLLEVEPKVAWQRVRGAGRPLAQGEEAFRALYEEREPLYREVADATAEDADDVVLAAAGIHAGLGSLELLGDLVPGERALALVADAHVGGIYGAAVQLTLGSRLASTHALPSGEEAKTIASVERLLHELRLDRSGAIVALGGGCTTDAAGFAAAVYLRGIDWVAVPTSLAGQVDAAIGGKTAVNLPQGKNLAGAFHWPRRTVIDPAVLESLPEAERRAGMAEAVKTGLLAGEPLWELPEPELVRRCAAFKAAVCLRDPHDRGERAVLNLGHTFAHALEAGSDHTVSHGDAVALGLLAALRLSGLEEQARVVQELLQPRAVRADPERAWAALGRDKKSAGGRVRLVLLEAPGRPATGVELPDDDVRRELDRLIAR